MKEWHKKQQHICSLLGHFEYVAVIIKLTCCKRLQATNDLLQQHKETIQHHHQLQLQQRVAAHKRQLQQLHELEAHVYQQQLLYFKEQERFHWEHEEAFQQQLQLHQHQVQRIHEIVNNINQRLQFHQEELYIIHFKPPHQPKSLCSQIPIQPLNTYQLLTAEYQCEDITIHNFLRNDFPIPPRDTTHSPSPPPHSHHTTRIYTHN